jgi:hypothetical protein
MTLPAHASVRQDRVAQDAGAAFGVVADDDPAGREAHVPQLIA